MPESCILTGREGKSSGRQAELIDDSHSDASKILEGFILRGELGVQARSKQNACERLNDSQCDAS